MKQDKPTIFQWVFIIGVLLLMCHPSAFAALPTMPSPGDAIGGGSVATGDWLGSFGAWFKKAVTIAALVLVAWGFISMLSGAISRWKKYTNGHEDIGGMKEYFIMSAILGVFLVFIASYAISVLT